jgi:hypothetical protein
MNVIDAGKQRPAVGDIRDQPVEPVECRRLVSFDLAGSGVSPVGIGAGEAQRRSRQRSGSV